MHDTQFDRRHFLKLTAGFALASGSAAGQALSLPLEQATTDTLTIGYYTAGPEGGRPVVLIHDLGYDTRSYDAVARILAGRAMRVLVPHLRGHGTTRFHEVTTPRSFRQAVLAADMIGFIDALHIPEAVFGGTGWGAGTARAFAALKPTRCVGLVAASDILPARAGDTADDPRHAAAERELAAQLTLAVPAITLEGLDSPASGLAKLGARYSGPHQHRRLRDVGHDIAREAPQAFADAITELVRSAKWRT